MKGTMTTPILPPKILLIENDLATADQIRAALAGAGNGSLDVEWVRQLSEGFARLSKKGIAAILLELSLPDSHGIETFDKLFTAAPDVPILILGGNVNEALAKEAVGRGAQDYLLPGHLDYSLPRALRNAIERKAVEDALYVEKERAVVTLNSIGDAVLCTDISGNITYSDGFVTAFLRGPKKRSRIMRCASRDAAWASQRCCISRKRIWLASSCDRYLGTSNKALCLSGKCTEGRRNNDRCVFQTQSNSRR
jgi:CheY-like chemotaxis protein